MPLYSHLRDPLMRRPGWYPPPASRFIEYGPEDQQWAEPLGIGDTVYFDLRVRRDFNDGVFFSPHRVLLSTV